jgi:hypothetical protein
MSGDHLHLFTSNWKLRLELTVQFTNQLFIRFIQLAIASSVSNQPSQGSLCAIEANLALALAWSCDTGIPAQSRFGGRMIVLSQTERGKQLIRKLQSGRRVGMEWNGMEWSRVEWNGVEQNGMEWNAVQWNGVQWNGVQRNGKAVAWKGKERRGGVTSGVQMFSSELRVDAWTGLTWGSSNRSTNRKSLHSAVLFCFVFCFVLFCFVFCFVFCVLVSLMSEDFCFARVCVQIEFPKWIIPFCCVMVGGWWLPWEDSVILAGNEPDHEDLSVPRLHHCNPSCSIQHFPCLFFVKALQWRSPAALLCLWLAAALKKPDRVFWSSPFIAASSDEFSFCLW